MLHASQKRQIAALNQTPLGYNTVQVRPDLTFTVPKRYSNLQFLSAGAQGAVVSVDDSVTNTQVAVKKLDPMGHPDSALRAFREFFLLGNLKHPNIVHVYSVFSPTRTLEHFRDVYLVMERMDWTLAEVRTKPLKHETLSSFVCQILRGVNHLHKQGIFHRDLKPSNIAVNRQSQVKILDFGLARLFTPSLADEMTKYVVTRYYRAPEVVLGQQYSDKVDIWSIGCIFAELITGNVLFPGRDNPEEDQWSKIVNLLGTPSTKFIANLPKSAAMYRYVKKASSLQRTRRPLEETIRDEHFKPNTEDPRMNWTATDARRLISKMLELDPEERCSAEEALQDPYVQCWDNEKRRNAESSITSETVHFTIFPANVPAVSERNKKKMQQLDEKTLTLENLKEIIFDEVKRLECLYDPLLEWM